MEFKELIKKRRSMRSYDKVNIDKEEISELLLASYLAPSWKNSRTARYYVANEEKKIMEVLNALPDFNKNNVLNASLVITTYKKGISGFMNDKQVDNLGDKWGVYDLGLNNAYFILLAKDKGYDTLIMGLRDDNKIRDIFNIPEDEEIVSVIALGKGNKDIKERNNDDLKDINIII